MEDARTTARFRLLFVEDDTVVCQAIGQMLAMEFPAAKIYTAENGQQGLDLFREYRPQIVITDINMPLMSGIEMAEQIKAVQPDTSFIVLTGYSEKSYLKSFSAIGFYAYIIKPVDLDRLFEVVERYHADRGHAPEENLS